jgi:hypothetical protein
MSDRYTKVVLTVIAAALVLIVVALLGIGEDTMWIRNDLSDISYGHCLNKQICER